MRKESGPDRVACEKARQAIQERLDGPIAAEALEELHAHLAGCSACREVEAGLLAVQQALGSLPELSFPDEALEQVWDRTVRSEPPATRPASWWTDWRALAAAAVVAAALLGLWALGRHRLTPSGPIEVARHEYSEQEIEAAAAEAHMVLSLTVSALRRSRHVAVRDVLAGEVSPALRRIPVRLPGSEGAEPRRDSEI